MSFSVACIRMQMSFERWFLRKYVLLKGLSLLWFKR